MRAELLAAGGPELWREFMAELRTIHLGEPAPQRDGPSVMERLAKALRRRSLISNMCSLRASSSAVPLMPQSEPRPPASGKPSFARSLRDPLPAAENHDPVTDRPTEKITSSHSGLTPSTVIRS
jgi:hypothetical protein